MPICIECRHPVKTLWREGGGGKSGGHNIRLTVCKNCGRFCDKYVEHDFVVMFIDLVLIKPQVRDWSVGIARDKRRRGAARANMVWFLGMQVYRHLLHNTLMKDKDEFAVRLPSFPQSPGCTYTQTRG
jgi:hypothetical protein